MYSIATNKGIIMTFVLLALLLGVVFGFLLQKGDVGNFNTIVGQLLFRNITVLNIMMTAIIVGGTLMYALVDAHMISSLPLKASSIYGSAFGGVIFGIGMAILGYCPGTALAAVGQGAKDALFGILGMLVGAYIYLHYADSIKAHILTDTPSNLTFPEFFGISPYLIFLGLSVCLIAINVVFNKLRA